MRSRPFLLVLLGLAAAGILCLALYFFPPIHQRLAWRLADLQTRIHYALNPPDQIDLAPDQRLQLEIIVRATFEAIATQQAGLRTASAPAPAESDPTAAATAAPPSPTPGPPPTPIPAKTALTGIRYEWQSFNNCGPANLAMALSFWGWQGDQRDTRAWLRPNEDDANVMPEEMLAYVQANTALKAEMRVAGDLATVKRLVAAGFPVILEIGHHPPKDWWMGHYVVVSGYDDAYAALITQDSLIMADLPLPYAELQTRWWRDFNQLYLVLYPPERQAEVYAILGPDADPLANWQRALALAESEIPGLTERDLFFAHYNRAASLLTLGRAEEAAAAFDLAFASYRALPEKQRPWRVLWYRVEPYQAYYETGRYQAVIDLADATLSMLNKRGLEESHYWRGLAYEALGDHAKAIFDYQIAVQLRPSYQQAQAGLRRLEQP